MGRHVEKAVSFSPKAKGHNQSQAEAQLKANANKLEFLSKFDSLCTEFLKHSTNKLSLELYAKRNSKKKKC